MNEAQRQSMAINSLVAERDLSLVLREIESAYKELKDVQEEIIRAKENLVSVKEKYNPFIKSNLDEIDRTEQILKSSLAEIERKKEEYGFIANSIPFLNAENAKLLSKKNELQDNINILSDKLNLLNSAVTSANNKLEASKKDMAAVSSELNTAVISLADMNKTISQKQNEILELESKKKDMENEMSRWSEYRRVEDKRLSVLAKDLEIIKNRLTPEYKKVFREFSKSGLPEN